MNFWSQALPVLKLYFNFIKLRFICSFFSIFDACLLKFIVGFIFTLCLFEVLHFLFVIYHFKF